MRKNNIAPTTVPGWRHFCHASVISVKMQTKKVFPRTSKLQQMPLLQPNHDKSTKILRCLIFYHTSAVKHVI
jgi:hypothetical protein